MSDLPTEIILDPAAVAALADPPLAGKSLGEILIDIANSAQIPAKLTPGIVRGMLPKHFRATGPWVGWTVAAVYDKSDFALLVGFMTPKGNKLSLYDWPDCVDRDMLMTWRPQG